MASPLTPLAVAALGLLAERPMHPYEMYQVLVAREEHRLVKVRPGSLYHTVDRLEQHSLVGATGTTREGNRPERTTYTITPAGHAALLDRLREILRVPVNEYPQLPVGIAEAHNLPVEEVRALLSERVGHLDHDLVEISTLIAGVRARALPEAYWLEADHLHTMLAAERDWLETAITRLENEDLPWPTAKH